MYLDNLDSFDQQILSLLTKNARYSYSEIGDIIGLSRVAVKSRIDALEKKGIIEEYTTIINPQKSAEPYDHLLLSSGRRSRTAEGELSAKVCHT